MKYFIFFFLMIFASKGYSQENEKLLNELNKKLSHQDAFIKEKHREIHKLQEQAREHDLKGEKRQLFRSYIELFEEYRSFKYDSAYYYVERAKGTAREIKDISLLNKARVKEGFALLSAGLFKEALDSLRNINKEDLDPQDRYDYFFTYARTFYDLANYNTDLRFQENYIRKGNSYLSEAIKVVDRSSKEYWEAEGLKRLKQSDWGRAETAYLHLIENFSLAPEDLAVATSSLSFVYEQMGNNPKSIHYLLLAAIADIEAATMENVALRNLARKLYEHGNLEEANRYVHKALDDATFYNARHRKIEISSILPIIEGAQLLKLEEKNKSLQRTVILLAILGIIIFIFLAIIYKQLKEKNAARKALSEYNQKLQEMNLHLKETDAIKQDYITYFLNATSQLFNKISQFQASTVQKVKTKQPEEILNLIKKYSIKNERNELFRQFDEVFLKLFPSFVEDFDNLFPPENKKPLKEGELLNTEHRIFALYRLGIQDSQQIAEFLDLSVTTIYTYKTRVKSRSNHRDTFEEEILKIKTLE